MNKAILVGNLTKDPELSTTSSGISVCKFTIAVTRRFANAEGNRETDFLPIIVWRQIGENCHKYLKKGSKAGVVGTIQTRSYDDKDGIKRYVTEIVADEVEFLSSKTSSGDGGEFIEDMAKPAVKSGGKKPIAELAPIDDDDLPF
ncbi:MAG: single-stranded DNA-binding protein [Firmicutes bacterium]|nr:single-stranded DNA-binding protein [Bacillota bacterium]